MWWQLFWKKQVWRRGPILTPKVSVLYFNTCDGKSLKSSITNFRIQVHLSRVQMQAGRLRIDSCLWAGPSTLHTAVVGTVRPLLGWRRNGQATLYLCQKHLLLCDYIVYRKVILGPIIILLGQSIIHWRFRIVLPHRLVFESNWKFLWVTVFSKWREKVCSWVLCASPLLACLFNPALRGIKLSAKNRCILRLERFFPEDGGERYEDCCTDDRNRR